LIHGIVNAYVITCLVGECDQTEKDDSSYQGLGEDAQDGIPNLPPRGTKPHGRPKITTDAVDNK